MSIDGSSFVEAPTDPTRIGEYLDKVLFSNEIGRQYTIQVPSREGTATVYQKIVALRDTQGNRIFMVYAQTNGVSHQLHIATVSPTNRLYTDATYNFSSGLVSGSAYERIIRSKDERWDDYRNGPRPISNLLGVLADLGSGYEFSAIHDQLLASMHIDPNSEYGDEDLPLTSLRNLVTQGTLWTEDTAVLDRFATWGVRGIAEKRQVIDPWEEVPASTTDHRIVQNYFNTPHPHGYIAGA
jgi:hypothetical protein